MIKPLHHLTTAEYRSFDAVSQSDLKRCWENPQLYHEPRGQQSPCSPEQQWGRDFEAFVRSPVIDVCIMPDTIKRRQGKKWEEFKSQHQGERILTKKEYDQAFDGMWRGYRNLMHHDHAAKLLDAAEWHRRFTWPCVETGMQLKCEMDLLDTGIACVIDLKTAANVSPHKFGNDIIKHGYDIQAAMYLRAARLLDPEQDWTFAWVVVRNQAPYNVEVYDASDALIEFGEKRLDERLHFFRGCVDSGRWVTPTHGITTTIYPPRWAFGQWWMK